MSDNYAAAFSSSGTLHSNTRSEAAERLMRQIFSPAASPIPSVDYAIAYRFSEHVGGDVADVFDCGTNGIFVSLADIEGNGPEAATHAALVKYGIRAYAAECRTPADVSKRLNSLYLRNCRCERTESFATLFLALIDRAQHTMTYVSAGYESAILVHPNGYAELLAASGPIVGVLEDRDARFAERTIPIAPGTLLVAVSDGVTEARYGNRQFGLSRTRRAIGERPVADLNALVHEIIQRAVTFCRGKVTDDMAVLAVRFAAEAE